MSETILYGISNCDTVRKARRQLEANDIAYTFHDFKKQGVDEELLDLWLSQVPLDTLLNRRSTTWRKLDNAAKTDVDEKKAKQLMQENTSLIKRPVIVHKNNKTIKIHAGFNTEEYATILGI